MGRAGQTCFLRLLYLVVLAWFTSALSVLPYIKQAGTPSRP
jgi:hypothetical protein